MATKAERCMSVKPGSVACIYLMYLLSYPMKQAPCFPHFTGKKLNNSTSNLTKVNNRV